MTSPARTVSIQSVDPAAQEDAKQVVWTGRKVGTPFSVAADSPFGMTLRRVRLEPNTSSAACPTAPR